MPKLIPLFCALLLGSGMAHAEPGKRPAKSPQHPDVVQAEFGLFNPTPHGENEFIPTRVLPLTPEQAYGWVIELRPGKNSVRWREEFELPRAPESWGPPETEGRRRIAGHGRIAITERTVTPLGGNMLFNFWAVAAGDPEGPYRIRVFVNGRLAGNFEFTAKAPPPVSETVVAPAPPAVPAFPETPAPPAPLEQ